MIARLATHEPLEAIVADLAQRYDLTMEEVATPVERFVSQMESEHLFERADGPESETVSVPDAYAVPAPSREEASEFCPPVLTIHTDLEDLLQLDPIHDVDDAGWPIAQPNLPEQD